MLLLSYILTGALELSIIAAIYRFGDRIMLWSYGFLLFSSLLSIPLETGAVGKKVRAEMKALGIDVARYDLWSNLLRVVVYLLVLRNLLPVDIGALAAYTIAIISLILAVRRLSKS